MTNLNINNLHTTDFEIQQPASRSNLKIYDLSDTCSEMRELADDEIRDIVGGCPGDPHDDKRYTVNLCPGDPYDD
jgi:hypothetical protein